MSREELKRLIADDAYAASFQTMGQYRSALLKAIAGRSADRNRPTMAPGGCECAKCGAIFIGGVEHDLCGVCAADSAQDVARAPEGWKLVPIRPTKKMIDAAQGYVWVAEEDATEEGIWRNMIAATPPAPVCETCNGRGEVGGFQVTGFGQGGYDSQPCPDCAVPAAPAVAPAPSDELASMTRMFNAACADLGAINEALGLDPNDGGAEPILDAIAELKRERDQYANYAAPAQASPDVIPITGYGNNGAECKLQASVVADGVVRVELVEATPAQAEQQREPASSCDPADICAGCRCKYNTYGQAEQQGMCEHYDFKSSCQECGKIEQQGDGGESAQDYLDTLAAVLNAIGYTEEFAAAHPDLKVSDGVKLFLAKQRGAIECQAHIGPDCTECGGSGFWDGEQPSARVSLSDDMAARIKNLCASYFIEQGDDFQIGANTVARRVIAILAASAAQGDSNGN